MRAALDYCAAKPALVAATGSAGGFVAWFAAHAQHLILLFQLVGGFFGCLLAVVSFLFVTPRCVRFLKAWRRRGFSRADVE